MNILLLALVPACFALNPVIGRALADAFGGLAVGRPLVTRGHPQVLQQFTFTAGDLWAAAGMLVFAVYTVSLRRTPELLTALPQFTVMGCAATLALLPFAVLELTTAPPTLAAWTWPWLAAVVLVTSIGAFLGYNVTLARDGPVLAGGI